MSEFEIYHELRESGNSVEATLDIARSNNLDQFGQVRMLREVFGYSLIDAKRSITESTTNNTSSNWAEDLLDILDDFEAS